MKELLTIAVAATSRSRVAELAQFLGDIPVRLAPYDELTTLAVSLRQEGDSLEENAKNRALSVAGSCRFAVLAEESGLEVTALSGRPGVRSASYAHGLATDAENNAALLRDMEEIAVEERGARFRSVLALALPGVAEPIVAEGVCSGWVGRQAGAASGIGYEPIFFVADAKGRALAALDPKERAAWSHVALAARALRPELIRYLNELIVEVERIVR